MVLCEWEGLRERDFICLLEFVFDVCLTRQYFTLLGTLLGLAEEEIKFCNGALSTWVLAISALASIS